MEGAPGALGADSAFSDSGSGESNTSVWQLLAALPRRWLGEEAGSAAEAWLFGGMSVALVLFAGIASGLTLGLCSLDKCAWTCMRGCSRACMLAGARS
eukprot:365759-Chlamydomonas_euryale.AAC.9